MACYLNQFRPLAETTDGRRAIEEHDLPPFIDASCRREPDLESVFPSISALCRGEHFAPRLQVGDIVAYMTKDFIFPPKTARVRRLVAVLRVVCTCESHEQAAEWYRQGHLPPPRNCMFLGSKPLPLNFTDRYKRDLREWDLHYWRIARKHGVFHACETIFCELFDPPRFTNQQLVEWFGTIPDTRALPPLPPEDFRKLLNWLSGQPSRLA